MKKTLNPEELQDKIYKQMSAKKKLAILDMFYKTGKILNNTKENDRKYSHRNLNLHRQST